MTQATPVRRALAAEAALLLAAAIWGFAFVAQRQGMDHMGPFLFNGLRFALGCLPLIPFLLRVRRPPGGERAGLRGLFLGLVLFLAASLQQVGIVYTTVAKAGFITGLYILFVPILGVLLGQRVGARVAAGVVVGATGLYLLTLHGTPDGGDARTAANVGDLLMIAGAVLWAVHILAVGRWAPRVVWPELAITQFATCAAASLITAILLEPVSVNRIAAGVMPLLYAGLLSVGAGYTIQVVAQRDAPPTPAAVILSLETVFAALGGWWLLSESLDGVQLTGCGLMLAAMILASLPASRRAY